MSTATARLIGHLRQWIVGRRAGSPRVAARFLPYLRRRRMQLGIATACAFGYALTRLLEPWPIKLIFDSVLLDHPLPGLVARYLAPVAGSRLGLLNALVAAIVLLAVTRGILYYHREVRLSQAGQRVVADVRRDLYNHLQRLSLNFHAGRKSGDLLMRLSGDILMLREMLVALLQTVVSELFMLLGMIVVMLLMDWQLSLVGFMVMPPLFFFTRYYGRPMKQVARKQRKREGSLAAMAAEALAAIKVVQAFVREKFETDRFQMQNQTSLRAGLKAARLEAKLNYAVEFSLAAATAAVLALGVRKVLQASLTPGDLLVFAAYLRAFYRPLRRLSRVTEQLARSAAAGERILEIADTRPAVFDLPGAVEAPPFRGAVSFEAVAFRYPPGDRAVLRDVSLRIRPGERVAVVGRIGSGKSTLVSLIPRFHDPTPGRILIDGHDVREFTLASLRRQVSLVLQEPMLFATTIAENIAYGKPDATPEEIARAAELAGIHRFVGALPGGYETVLGERGATLSAGQRQCIAIARAIVKDTPIVILDEPTAALDRTSAALVMDALRRLMEGRTVILVSHDWSAIERVDRVVMLADGRISDQGSYQEMLARWNHRHVDTHVGDPARGETADGR